MCRKRPPSWAKIARAYADDQLSINEICKIFSVSRNNLYQKINSENWPKRASRRLSGRGSSPNLPASGAGAENPDGAGSRNEVSGYNRENHNEIVSAGSRRNSELVDRLYMALDQKMKKLEDRMARPDEVQSASTDQDARTLATLARLFEKLTELDNRLHDDKNKAVNETDLQENKNGSESAVEDLDAERMRDDLARRLARLSQVRDS